MTDFSTLLQSGNAWLFIPSAVLLGALHGLEPGHSKTLMAAFIVAIRGTVFQAVLLGLAATISHTAIVWIIALAGLHFGSQFNTAATEPYLQIVSAVIIIGVALWMLWRTRADQNAAEHRHSHGDETRLIDTGHGIISVEVFEDGVPPRWRIRSDRGAPPAAASVKLVTLRAEGSTQAFDFVACGDFLQSTAEIPEPHEFTARLTLSHGDHGHSYDLAFHEHHHDHSHGGGLDVGAGDGADAHERAHADEIRHRFAGQQNVTTGQIVMFGLTGGLIPCPASITVLLLCLQLKQFALGATLVLSFSVGLALTMVAVGAAAALSVKHVSTRWSGFDRFARRAPYASGALIIVVGLYTGYLGLAALAGPHP
jgi:nickel/cobalt transporter (NicO) family protein